MLIEPLGDLAIAPMLAAQREDGFAVRFELAARPARHFIFGLWLQIHFAVTFLRPIILSEVAQLLRNSCATARHLTRPLSCAKGRCLTELLVLKTVFIAVCIVDSKISHLKNFAYRIVRGLAVDFEG
jgi:hypothetical protein